jgi:hypothetical protein
MTKPEDARRLPVITTMPVIQSSVIDDIKNTERQTGVTDYLWTLGASFARQNPQHIESYDAAFLNPQPPEEISATPATVLIVLRALEMQATNDGYRLPEIPCPIDPSPALTKFFQTSKTESEIIEQAYDAMIDINPEIESIIQYIMEGAPSDLARIITRRTAIIGAVYAYYGVKSLLGI